MIASPYNPTSKLSPFRQFHILHRVYTYLDTESSSSIQDHRIDILASWGTRLQVMRQAGSRHASAASGASNDSLESTAYDFFETKIEQLMEYKSYVELVKEGILEARDQQRLLALSEFTELISPVLGRLTTANSTLRRHSAR